MNTLVKLEQNVTIIPKDFNYTNIGSVTEVSDKGFRMKMKYPTTGIKELHICDFYSKTPHGTLYFTSHAKEVENDELFIANPVKHRFLQRRQFTRVTLLTDTVMTDKDENTYEISTIDLSAGGLKFSTNSSINLDKEYKVTINLDDDQTVYCWLQPIRMERQDTGKYILSGRFVNQSNVDKMILIQYCMNKNVAEKNQ